MEACPVCGKEVYSGIRVGGELYHYECFFKREEKVEKEAEVTFEDVLYYERLPSYRTVEQFFREYTRPERYLQFWDFVERYGIYQFWNKEYIECLAGEIKRRVGSDFVLEVAAGDGMLSFWLRNYGVNIKATDSGEMYDKIKKRAEVEIIDAVSAIRKYKPKMVIASWLPWNKPIDIQIFDEKVPIIVLIGEEYGATGSKRFWDENYWEKAGYTKEYSECDKWNFCRSDYIREWGSGYHSSTAFYNYGSSGSTPRIFFR
jgi:hypothetical protein